MAFGPNFAGGLSKGLGSFADYMQKEQERRDRLNVIEQAALLQKEIAEERKAKEAWERERQEKQDARSEEEWQRKKTGWQNEDEFNNALTETEEYTEFPDVGTVNALAAKHGVTGSAAHKTLIDGYHKDALAGTRQQRADDMKENADRNYELNKQKLEQTKQYQAAMASHREAMQSIARTRASISSALAANKISQMNADALRRELAHWEKKVEEGKAQLATLKTDRKGRLAAKDLKLAQSIASSLTNAEKRAAEIGAKLAGGGIRSGQPPNPKSLTDVKQNSSGDWVGKNENGQWEAL